MSASRIIRSSVTVTLLSLATMAAGFLLQVFLASAFGASSTTDAYLAATTIPTLLNSVFLTALSITFIPVFIEYETQATDQEAWHVAASFSSLVVLVLSIFAACGMVFSEHLVLLIAPGLAQAPATLALAAELQRIMLPSIVFLALGGLLGGLFYAHQMFFLPTLGPFVNNAVILLLAWWLAPQAGINAVAIGVLAGSVLQVLFLAYFLRRRFTFSLGINLRHPGLQQIVWLMTPWLLGAMIYKANPVVDRIIASQFPAGTISILGYAYLLIQVAVFAGSKGASLAVFPAMSQAVSRGHQTELPSLIDTGLRIVITLIIPAAVLLIFAGEPLVAVLLERGAFSSADSVETSRALLAYLGALLFLSLGNVVTYVYYALQDTKTPAIVGIVGMGLNVALAFTLQSSAGYLAPAISFSIMTCFNFTILVLVLKHRLGQLVERGFLSYCTKTTLAGAVMGITLFISGSTLSSLEDLHVALPISRLAYDLFFGGLAFAGFWSLLNRSLVAQVLQRISYRFST